MISYAYANHGPFGIYDMPMPDAILWSFLGMVLGVILSFCYVKFRRWLDGE